MVLVDGLKPIGHEKPLTRRKDQSQGPTSRPHPTSRANGLILQTPNNSYQAPAKGKMVLPKFKGVCKCLGLRDNTEGLMQGPLIGKNSMLALNSEHPSCVHNRMTLAFHLGKDRRLATRHGFPSQNANLAVELDHKSTPVSSEIERWKRQPRHSISSQVTHPFHLVNQPCGVQIGSNPSQLSFTHSRLAMRQSEAAPHPPGTILSLFVNTVGRVLTPKRVNQDVDYE